MLDDGGDIRRGDSDARLVRDPRGDPAMLGVRNRPGAAFSASVMTFVMASIWNGSTERVSRRPAAMGFSRLVLTASAAKSSSEKSGGMTYDPPRLEPTTERSVSNMDAVRAAARNRRRVEGTVHGSVAVDREASKREARSGAAVVAPATRVAGVARAGRPRARRATRRRIADVDARIVNRRVECGRNTRATREEMRRGLERRPWRVECRVLGWSGGSDE